MKRIDCGAALVCALLSNACAATLASHAAHAQQPPVASGSMAGMMMPGPLGIPMDRSGSGTSWIPDAVSMPSGHTMTGNWDLMLHGLGFAQYDDQGGPRGATQLGSINWGMLMATHDFAGGRLQLRSMLSLDAVGVGTEGYPELLQTGETYRGLPLHDRQHPHDVFMEMAALYDRAITCDAGVELYVAPAGEPALGPVAFMHRPSGMDDPMAPIGHHWQDATHESYGVATVGLFTRRWKFEGSIFNGQEADDNRWHFEFHPLASYSGRVTFNPDSAWSLSASYGFLKNPELLEPGVSLRRMVASIQNGQRIGLDGQWATTLVWGANAHPNLRGLSNSVLAESEVIFDGKNTVFARAEYVQKLAADLGLEAAPYEFTSGRMFDVGEVTLGYVRELRHWRGMTLGLGAVGTLNVVPISLDPVYGSRTPLGAMVFLRVRAHGSPTTGMHDMEGMSAMNAVARPTPLHTGQWP